MSQTIEELITAKEQELGLNQTELEALKDYTKQVSVLIDANNRIVLNRGDDKLIAGKGNNVFYFRVGDGVDALFDEREVA